MAALQGAVQQACQKQSSLNTSNMQHSSAEMQVTVLTGLKGGGEATGTGGGESTCAPQQTSQAS